MILEDEYLRGKKLNETKRWTLKVLIDYGPLNFDL